MLKKSLLRTSIIRCKNKILWLSLVVRNSVSNIDNPISILLPRYYGSPIESKNRGL
jgi:hypothetical protein